MVICSRRFTPHQSIHQVLTKILLFTNILNFMLTSNRYASLFFIAGIDQDDNELITLEIIHRYVEILDKYFGNVCELDLIFNFNKAYFILDELLIVGELQESSKKSVLRIIGQQDSIEDAENEKLEKKWSDLKNEFIESFTS
ncbi:hypothetical protein K7432_016700 [Basidiobolus ranarum]|uniref:AP complex mu/sigma subunit domain-containing protein n=1 Tax=Basidiobolus ranarum TaxID=34480 RepID=A0ABR2WED8_9FUNG